MAGIVLLVAAMVLVPAWGLLHKPARFGWQMYASASRVPEFTLVHSSGQRDPVRPADFIANRRPEVRYERHLPPLLCERFPDVRYVLLTGASPEVSMRYQCGSA